MTHILNLNHPDTGEHIATLANNDDPRTRAAFGQLLLGAVEMGFTVVSKTSTPRSVDFPGMLTGTPKTEAPALPAPAGTPAATPAPKSPARAWKKPKAKTAKPVMAKAKRGRKPKMSAAAVALADIATDTDLSDDQVGDQVGGQSVTDGDRIELNPEGLSEKRLAVLKDYVGRHAEVIEIAGGKGNRYTVLASFGEGEGTIWLARREVRRLKEPSE